MTTNILDGNADGEPATGASADNPGTSPASAPPPSAAPIGADGVFSDGWTAILPEDMRENPSLQGYRSLPDLAKSLINTKRMVGADKARFLFAPNENSTHEERREFYQKLGCPESPDKYEIKLPEGSTPDERMQSHFAKIAHERGLNNEQFQSLVDGYNDYQVELAKLAQLEADERFDNGVKQLQQEWRSSYDEKLQTANRAVKEFGLTEFLSEKGLQNDPDMVKVMYKIGSMLLESKGPDTFAGGSANGSVRQQIDAIRNDRNHPYHHRDMPGHDQAVALVTQLYNKLS